MGAHCSCCGDKIQNDDEFNFHEEEEAFNEDSQQPIIPFSDFILQDEPTLNGYCFLNEIGCGCMSRVFEVVKGNNDELYAAKVYDNNKIGRSKLTNEDPPYVCIQRELDLMAKLSHRYLISLVDAFNEPTTNSLIIILPFAPLGNLKSLIDKNSCTDTMLNTCFHQIALACAYLHSHNIVHRDIKPENFLVFAEDYYVLSDLSVSQELESDDQEFIDTKGSPAFLSPEECEGTPFAPKPADVWAYGVSLFHCYYGYFPFDIDSCIGQSMANTIMMIAEHLHDKELVFPENADENKPLKTLLEKLLVKDPKKRMTFDEIVEDPFFEQAREIDKQNILKEKELMEEEEEDEKDENHNDSKKSE